MAFDKEGFLAWLSAQDFASGDDYVHSLGLLELHCQWSLDALLPAGFTAADAQLTQEIAALPTATQEQQQQHTRLGNWRSAFRKYHKYLLARAAR